jgi:hypothetical protein
VDSAPRISPRLVAVIDRADTSLPIAEIWRRVGATAERIGVSRPSYETVRVLVHRARRLRRQPSTGAIVVDIALRSRPPDALVTHLSGVGVSTRRFM